MANVIAVVGDTGQGKSTSIESLNPAETTIINVVGKPLPFKGWRSKYKTPAQADKSKGERANLLVTSDYKLITNAIAELAKTPTVKNIVLDDFQYLMSGEYMDRAKERGYDKFTEMALHVWDLLKQARSLRDDLNIICLTHDEEVADSGGDVTVRKMKTIGKMLDQKVTLEGLFTVVLFTEVHSSEAGNKYYFRTQTDGVTRAKSPKGMFDEVLIPNDLQYVIERIYEYEHGED